jgi:hypothetical protein
MHYIPDIRSLPAPTYTKLDQLLPIVPHAGVIYSWLYTQHTAGLLELYGDTFAPHLIRLTLVTPMRPVMRFPQISNAAKVDTGQPHENSNEVSSDFQRCYMSRKTST